MGYLLRFLFSPYSYVLPHPRTTLCTQGWGNSAPTGGTTNASFVSGGIANQNQSTLKPSTGPAGAGIAIAPGDINYVVERCEVSVNCVDLLDDVM